MRVGVAKLVGGGQVDLLEQPVDFGRAGPPAGSAAVHMQRALQVTAHRVLRLSDANGSWKTICTSLL